MSGESIGVDLPRTGTLKGNDVLINAAGELIQIIAKPQTVTKVTADDNFTLMKGAYHLGNRHVPLMFDYTDSGYALYFENDHVLAQMLVRLGLQVEPASIPFEPETGAYQSGQSHSHSHSDSHNDSHNQVHSHSHSASHSASDSSSDNHSHQNSNHEHNHSHIGQS